MGPYGVLWVPGTYREHPRVSGATREYLGVWIPRVSGATSEYPGVSGAHTEYPKVYAP